MLDSDAYCAATLGGQKPLKMLTVTHFPIANAGFRRLLRSHIGRPETIENADSYTLSSRLPLPPTFWKYSHPPSHHISNSTCSAQNSHNKSMTSALSRTTNSQTSIIYHIRHCACVIKCSHTLRDYCSTPHLRDILL